MAAGDSPTRVAVSPDGESAYVVNFVVAAFPSTTSARAGRSSPKSPATVAAGFRPSARGGDPGARVPTSKEQCKNGGWRNFPEFKNQGQCVAFVERGPKR